MRLLCISSALIRQIRENPRPIRRLSFKLLSAPLREFWLNKSLAKAHRREGKKTQQQFFFAPLRETCI
jgi:hypothetical protein